MSDFEFNDYEDESYASQYSDEVNSDVENELYGSIYFSDKPTANDVPVVTYVSGLDTNTSFAQEKISSLNEFQLSEFDKSSAPLKEFSSNNSINVSNGEAKHVITKTPISKPEKTITQVPDSAVELKNSIRKSTLSKNHESAKLTESEESDSSILYFNKSSLKEIDMVTNMKKTLDNSVEIIDNSSNGSSYFSGDSDNQSNSCVEVYTKPVKKIKKRTFSAKDWKSITISNEDFSDSDSSDKLSKSLPLKFEKERSLNVIEDLWHIDTEDRLPPRKCIRFFNSPKCDTCKKEGHKAKFCPTRSKKCYICGANHLAKQCNKRVCSSCLSFGHSFYQCPRRYSTRVYCEICRSNSHISNSCPDLWRRFHATTSFGNLVRSPDICSDSSSNFCYNCGFRGHLGYDCLQSKPKGSPSPWPFVVNYDNPPINNSFADSNHPSTPKRKKRKNRQYMPDKFDASTPVNSGSNSNFSPTNSFARKRRLFYEEQYFQRTSNNHLEVTQKLSKRKRKQRNKKKKCALKIAVSKSERNAFTC